VTTIAYIPLGWLVVQVNLHIGQEAPPGGQSQMRTETKWQPDRKTTGKRRYGVLKNNAPQRHADTPAKAAQRQQDPCLSAPL